VETRAYPISMSVPLSQHNLRMNYKREGFNV
jgi:hypothetical protein